MQNRKCKCLNISCSHFVYRRYAELRARRFAKNKACAVFERTVADIVASISLPLLYFRGAEVSQNSINLENTTQSTFENKDDPLRIMTSRSAKDPAPENVGCRAHKLLPRPATFFFERNHTFCMTQSTSRGGLNSRKCSLAMSFISLCLLSIRLYFLCS